MYGVNDYEQVEHEQVIAARVKQHGLFYRVNANLDNASSGYRKDCYPDIIVIDKKNNVLFIEEVETESSLTENVRNEKWMRYSELGYPFNLIVPKSKIVEARQLLNGLNISRLYYYQAFVIDFRFRKVISLNI